VCSESNAQGKISSQQCTLESWPKDIYFWDSYSLSDSFWAHTAQINRLTGISGQSTLKTATLSSPGYDGGMHFCRCAHQGCKKSVRIKVLVNNSYGAKTLSIILTNFIISCKPFNNERQKLLPPLFILKISYFMFCFFISYCKKFLNNSVYLFFENLWQCTVQ
jgi:hypothetical protein